MFLTLAAFIYEAIIDIDQRSYYMLFKKNSITEILKLLIHKALQNITSKIHTCSINGKRDIKQTEYIKSILQIKPNANVLCSMKMQSYASFFSAF